MIKEKNIYKKLTLIQNELKVPKSNVNNFGKYSYRSIEDIEAKLKPLLLAHNCTVHIIDEIVQIGDRYYLKATAIFIDIETGESIQNTGFAREALEKKGMDMAQLTGACSSYSRKYSLGGLFLIDDTTDQDSMDNTSTTLKEKSTEEVEFDFKENEFKEKPIIKTCACGGTIKGPWPTCYNCKIAKDENELAPAPMDGSYSY
jgi:hypothetical protein